MAETARVFDRASFHLESVRQRGLDDHQAYVHMGLYFGWAIDRGLTALWLEDRTPVPFERYRAHQMTAAELLHHWDGALRADMFTPEGAAFAADYLDHETGAFLDDYLRHMTRDLPSEFHVADSWDNHAKLGRVLDDRFRAWRATWAPSDAEPPTGAPSRPVLPAEAILPALAVTSGVAVPGGPLGIRARRPASVQAVQAAAGGDGWLALFALKRPGRHPDPQPQDLLAVGVAARVERITPSTDDPSANDVLLQLVARVERRAWAEGPWRAEVQRLPEPEPERADRPVLDALRRDVGRLVALRRARSEAPGMLALAAVLPEAGLVDGIARELPLSRDERLVVLEAPDLGSRAAVVTAALRRILD